MTEHDRGAYTPREAPLAFDPRAPKSRRPAPMMLIASCAVLLVLVAALFMALRHGALRSDTPARPVGAPVAAIKSASPVAAEAARSVDVYAAQNVPASASATPHFAAEPETPQPRPAASRLQVRPVAPVPVRIEPATPNPPQNVAAASGSTLIRPGAADAPSPSPSRPTARPRTAAAESTSAAGAEPPLARSAAIVAESKPATPASAAAGVQIGAYSTRALADRGYADANAMMVGLMSGKAKSVTMVEKDGKTLYRTLITGFADHDAARAFCASLAAKGARCIVKG